MFSYRWNIKDGYKKEKNNLNVFSTFACGGGSTMGYKLAGYNVIGANDIDPQMAGVYIKNHKPEHYYLCDIRDFNKQIENKEVDDSLYNLDILDGSPPCSTFSMAGSREKAWGKEKKFREGQAMQRLDDLFFSFIETARLLQPKVVVGENVKGMISGNAKGYVIQIKQMFEMIGYNVQVFLLNGASMGLPQKRERVFIICSRKDLKFPKLKLQFNEKQIGVKEATSDIKNKFGNKLTENAKAVWDKVKIGESAAKVKKGSWFSRVKLHPRKASNTLTAGSSGDIWHWEKPFNISQDYIARLSSFPDDYDFNGIDKGYLCGMSVPPVMIAQIANQINLQWFNK